jgi:hypothetical protein
MMAASAVLDAACRSPFACVNLYGSMTLRSERSPPTAGEGDENRFRENRNELTRTTMLLHVRPARALSGKKRTLCVVKAALSASSSARCFWYGTLAQTSTTPSVVSWH